LKIGAYMVDKADPAYGTSNQGSATAIPSTFVAADGGILIEVPTSYVNGLGAVVMTSPETAFSFAMFNTAAFSTTSVTNVLASYDAGSTDFDAILVSSPDADIVDGFSESSRIGGQKFDLAYTGSLTACEGDAAVAVVPGNWFDTHDITDLSYEFLASLPQSLRCPAREGLHAVLPFCGVSQSKFVQTDADVFMDPDVLCMPQICFAVSGTKGPFQIRASDTFETQTQSQVLCPERRLPDPAGQACVNAITSAVPLFSTHEDSGVWEKALDVAIDAASVAFPRIGAGISLCKAAAEAFATVF